ncbi:MAG: hypothetical protein J5563_01265 [Clostridia bacterium]|nr:hypothetical protein [Clostridia bacterium]
MSAVLLQAHRGVETDYPENTMPAYRAAVEQGYKIIEVDYRLTKDRIPVMCHNRTVNSRARLKDGSLLPDTVTIADVNYSDLLAYDFGIRKGERFRGTGIPLFSDVLDLARDSGVALKIDNKHFENSPEDRESVYRLIKRSGARVAVSCFTLCDAREVRTALPDADISFDGVSDESFLSEALEIAGPGRLQMWIPVQFGLASWAPKEWFEALERTETVKKYAKLGLWAIGPEVFPEAVKKYRPWAVETDGRIKPSDAKAIEKKLY